MLSVMIRKYFFLLTLTAAALFSCHNKREPGRVYMPDMAYSRAYEAYAPNNLRQEGINYNPSPVEGTIRRGDFFPYTLPNDSNGYKMAATVKDPLPPIDTLQMLEAQRLFNVNCAVCHGEKLNAQGPLAGKVGGIANLTLPQYVAEPEGQMFHVATYGKGNMGSYASQLSKKQRWMVIQYIKSVQAKISAGSSGAAGTDSTKNNNTAGAGNSTAKK